jgi:hypothetical protein
MPELVLYTMDYVLSSSVYLAPALRTDSGFDFTRYRLVYATGQQGRYWPVKKDSVRPDSSHCYMWTLFTVCLQLRILFWAVIQSKACTERACHTNRPPPGPQLLLRCQVKWLRQYSGRKITEGLRNVTVRGEKDVKSKGEARLPTVWACIV